MKESIIIFGFPGTGKTYAYEHQDELNATIQDSDSSHFHWLYKGDDFTDPVLDEDGHKVVHPAWPANYAEYISLTGREQKNPPDFIFVSTHKEVIEAISMLKFKQMYVVVPHDQSKDEYIQKYKARGSSEEFIKNLDENWVDFLFSTRKLALKLADDETNLNLIVLNKNVRNMCDIVRGFPTREV